MLFFTYQLWGLTGWQYPAALVAYYLLSLRVVRLAMPNYTALYRKSSELDAEFLRVHHRVKTAAEQIAFFDGGSREREIVEEAHANLMDHQWKIYWMNFKLGIVQDVFQSRIPEVFQWVLRFNYSYRYGGTDAQVLADSGASLNKNQTYLMSVIPQISGNLGAAIALSDRFAQVAGQIVRVAEFQEVPRPFKMAISGFVLASERSPCMTGAGARRVRRPAGCSRRPGSWHRHCRSRDGGRTAKRWHLCADC